MGEQSHEVVIDRDMAATMRDGTVLRADIFRPTGSGKYPVLLQRIPYGKRRPANNLDPEVAASHGYVVVIQDTRGRFASEGEYVPYVDNLQDGYDTVEWAAIQPWSNGKVGMYGGSYMGATQYLAARTLPPHLVCLFPAITWHSYYDGGTYRGGAFNLLDRVAWTFSMVSDTAKRKGIAIPPDMQSILAQTARTVEIRARGDASEIITHVSRIGEMLDSYFKHLPLKTLPIPREAAPYFFDYLAHNTTDEYWEPMNHVSHYSELKYPAFHVGGWYDLFCRGVLTNYQGLRQKAPTEEARKGQRLIMGPWTHGNFSGQAGEMNFGPTAGLPVPEFTNLHLSWFDYWLKGEQNGVLDGPPVRLFIMGKNTWRDEDEWPLSRTKYTRYFLHSAGNANSLNGDGKLSPIVPTDEPADTFIYDPKDPVPTRGGSILGTGQPPGVRDQRPVEERQDVLVYTSDILQQDLEVTGPLTVELWAATSAPDTDFTAKLVDVHPNGYAQNIQDGIIRARFRESPRHPRIIELGEVLQYRIDLDATSNVFLAGHQIRLEISSSNFPHYDRNPNTGHPFGEDAELQVARQTIFHDNARPSCVILPVIP